jgi:hypothetical protein
MKQTPAGKTNLLNETNYYPLMQNQPCDGGQVRVTLKGTPRTKSRTVLYTKRFQQSLLFLFISEYLNRHETDTATKLKRVVWRNII